MTRAAERRPGLRAALVAAALAAFPAPAAAGLLVVEDQDGHLIAAEELGPDGRWCLVWNHSVAGFAVSDCFRFDAGRLVLERSHQPDFAAGLGDVPGRGTVHGDGRGGYWIEGIEAPVPASGLVVRLGGPAVAHRLRIGHAERPLPDDRRGERVTIRVEER